eukprot:CAMPEP_0171296596 /NCGR_PEP_ID=MMETSP0816-20121228/5299_1 /TAXON_ID=420281 /ORGANISM="Proboscia inermis, Strain CCAP1064/1" /LENGTH=225 /DNA_ID=CAMNT_0011770187 /DNA_START=109 /DNA_END=786 /DNA_ORIENTATION=+
MTIPMGLLTILLSTILGFFPVYAYSFVSRQPCSTSTAIPSSANNLKKVPLFYRAMIPVLNGSFERNVVTLHMSDWADFAYDDEDEVLDIDFADENDSQEEKALVGIALQAPEVFFDGNPIVIPQGSSLPLSVENVEGVLAACRMEIETMFGYSAENRGVGITGGVDFVELDGPTVVVALKGRFWHTRPMVLARVGAYIMGRIPEVVDVEINDPYELTDEANNSAA